MFGALSFVMGLAVLGMRGAGAEAAMPADGDAQVTAVHVERASAAYSFSVTIRSNDTGCDHYVDWWEVVDERGKLVYRRVLLHDHADEQPFTRDGGPVAVAAGQVVTVRAHVHPTGYSGQAMRGSAGEGFSAVALPAGYAPDLAQEPPQPSGC